MFEHFAAVTSRAWPLFALLSFGSWLMISLSLWRLKSVKALDLDKSSSRAGVIESVVHSIAKLFVVTLSTAALTRLALAPDYRGGAFAVDAAFWFGGFVLLVFSLPSVVLIAILSKGLRQNGKPPSRISLASAAMASILFSGAGQLFAAAAFTSQKLTIVLSTPVIVPIPLIGAVMTASTWAHFHLLKSIIMSEKPSISEITKNAGLAVLPTFLVALLAAAALYPLLQTS